MNLITLALISSLTCQQPTTDALNGLWESNTTSRGGIGNNIEFRKDGSYTTAVVVLVDLAYDIKDGKLYISKNKGEPVNYEQGARFELNDKVLTLLGENGEKETRNRLTSKDPNSIVGEYKYRHYTGAIAYEQYTEDGLFKLRIPMTSHNGCYELKNKNVTFYKPKEELKQMQYSLSQGNLELKNSKGSYSYNLVLEGAWYKSDEIDYVKPEK